MKTKLRNMVVILVFANQCFGSKPLWKPDQEYLEPFMSEPGEYFQSDDPNTPTFPPSTEQDQIKETIHVENTNSTDNSNFDLNVHQLPPPPPPFIPQDPVHQYVNSYGGPYVPPGPAFGYPNNVMISPWAQYAAQPNIPIAYAPVHTEYEGFLVPVQIQQAPPKTPPPSVIQQQMDSEVDEKLPTNLQSPQRISSDVSYILKSLLPPNLIYKIVHWGSFIMSLFGVVAFGGLITTAICTLTPICTISFSALPFTAFRSGFNASKDNVSDTISSVERVRRATEFFNSALEKYEQLQKTVASKTKHE